MKLLIARRKLGSIVTSHLRSAVVAPLKDAVRHYVLSICKSKRSKPKKEKIQNTKVMAVITARRSSKHRKAKRAPKSVAAHAVLSAVWPLSSSHSSSSFGQSSP